MPPPEERLEGVLVSWNSARGFGFITPTTGGRDLFVHISDVAPQVPAPREGELVSYVKVLTSEGKRRAISVVRSGTSRPRRPPAKKLRGRRSALPWIAVGMFAVLLVLAVGVWGVGGRGDVLRWVALWYLGGSLLAFVVYAIDKAAAQRRTRRVPEVTLLVLGVLGGWPGAVVAQQLLRHKTRKARFQWVFWATVALNVGALAGGVALVTVAS